MIKVRAEINEMEKRQATEKTNLENNSNQYHDEFYQIFKKKEDQYYTNTFKKQRTLSSLLNKASTPVSLIKIDAKIVDRMLGIQIQKYIKRIIYNQVGFILEM